MEEFLRGDDCPLRNEEAFAQLRFEHLLAERNMRHILPDLLTERESARWALLRRIAEERAEKSMLDMYRRYARENGYLARWEELLAAGESAAMAYTVCIQEFLSSIPALRECAVPNINPRMH